MTDTIYDVYRSPCKYAIMRSVYTLYLYVKDSSLTTIHHTVYFNYPYTDKCKNVHFHESLVHEAMGYML